MWLLLFISGILAEEISLYSFRSPLMPDHSKKFITKGEAIPLRKFVRLGPPRPRSSGSLQTSFPINETSFEIQVTFNSAGDSPTEHIGLSMWLSEKPEQLGHLYGLTPEFRGISLFVDVAKLKLYGKEVTQDLTIDSILLSDVCTIDTKNKQSTVHIHVYENFFEVWVKDRRMKKCVSFNTNSYQNLYFGISSYSGENSNTAFDVLQVLTTELEDENEENIALREIEDSVRTSLSHLHGNLDVLKNILRYKIFRNIHNSPGFVETSGLLHDLGTKLQKIYLRAADLRLKMNGVHKDNSFTDMSNKEIVDTKNTLGRISLKIEGLMKFLSGEIMFDEVRSLANSQYEKNAGNGRLMIKELEGAGVNIERFKRNIVEDRRIWWVQLGFGVLLGAGLVLFILIIKIEKIKTII